MLFPVAHYENYTPRVWCVGDSITTGVGAATLPGWRYTLYTAYSGLITMVGSQSYGGSPDVLGTQASHDGHNGQTIVTLTANTIIGGTEIYKPDIAICLFGINDIITNGSDAATVSSLQSNALDELWNRRAGSWMQVVLCSILKNITVSPAYDTTVQAANALQAAMVAGKSYAANVTVLPGVYGSIQDPTVGGGYNDPTHPSDAGYINMGTVIATGIATAVRRARPVA